MVKNISEVEEGYFKLSNYSNEEDIDKVVNLINKWFTIKGSAILFTSESFTGNLIFSGDKATIKADLEDVEKILKKLKIKYEKVIF